MKRVFAVLVLLFALVVQIVVSADTNVDNDSTAERKIVLGSSHIKDKQMSYIYFGRYHQNSIGAAQPETGVEGVDYVKYEAATRYGYGPYYSIDPVKWRVLWKADETVLLFADKIVDSIRFNESYGYTYWDSCTIRSWLNGYDAQSNSCGIDYTTNNFMDAVFTPDEKEAMVSKNVDGVDDILYLLSSDDATNPDYGFDSNGYVEGGYNRKAQYTDYHWGADLGANWWLRDSARYPCDKRFVYASNGEIKYGGASVYHVSLGVRPAFRLKISDVLFTSGDALGGYSLTFLDKTRSFALKDSSGKTACQGDNIVFEYTGAIVGGNEYVSAMIVNSDEECVDYQQLVLSGSENGTVLFEVPDDIQAGEYTLKIFNEQYNGENRTGYSSDFVDVPLTVVNKPVFEILSFDMADNKIVATLSIPKSGMYNIVFSDYEGGKLNNLDIVTVTVNEDEVGVITQSSEMEIVFGAGDRIMLFADMSAASPECAAYVVE